MLESGKVKLNKYYLLPTVVARFTQINISRHKLGKKYFIMTSMDFSAAPHLRQIWTKGRRRRQGRRSVVAKTEYACLRQGTTLWTAA